MMASKTADANCLPTLEELIDGKEGAGGIYATSSTF